MADVLKAQSSKTIPARSGPLATALALVRPAFASLLALCAAAGMAQAGPFPDLARQCAVLVAVAGWMLWAVALNDVADAEVDRVNLARDEQRVIANGRASRTQVLVTGSVAAVVALGAALTLGTVPALVVCGGLLLAAAYSLPPVRLSGRGVVTSVLLPLGYVAVPYLLGAFSAEVAMDRSGVLLLVGLYLGFMGRLVLKDFRDEHGDRMYSKRTMLVRYGRARTCAFGAAFWTVGALVGLVALGAPPVLTVVTLAYVAVVLLMLRDIAHDSDSSVVAAPNRDVANIAAIAVVGRALVYTFVIQMVVETAGWAAGPQALIVAFTALVSLGMARECRTVLTPVPDPLTDEERVSLPPSRVDGAEADRAETPAPTTRGQLRPGLALGGGRAT